MPITSLMVYVTMLLTIVVLGHYLLFYVVFIFSFILLAFNIRELGSLRQLERKSVQSRKNVRWPYSKLNERSLVQR